MRESKRGFVFWAPRVLTILFALFISIFALDVFSEGQGFIDTVLALAMHLLPTLVVVVLLVLAWRWELVGVVAFAGLGLLYIVGLWGRFHWSAYAAIAGPMLLISGLFFLSWWKRRHGAPPGLPST